MMKTTEEKQQNVCKKKSACHMSHFPFSYIKCEMAMVMV